MRSGHPMFYELIEKMVEVHSQKNQDYGDGNPLGNFMEAEKIDVTPFKGILIRLSDKWSRICTLSKKAGMGGKVKDESIEDTLLDMANYALLAIIIRRETEKPTEPKVTVVDFEASSPDLIFQTQRDEGKAEVKEPYCYEDDQEDSIMDKFPMTGKAYNKVEVK